MPKIIIKVNFEEKAMPFPQLYLHHQVSVSEKISLNLSAEYHNINIIGLLFVLDGRLGTESKHSTVRSALCPSSSNIYPSLRIFLFPRGTALFPPPNLNLTRNFEPTIDSVSSIKKGTSWVLILGSITISTRICREIMDSNVGNPSGEVANMSQYFFT